MKSRNMRKNGKEKWNPLKASFCVCHGNVPLPEEFGEVVAALVAGDRLPPICRIQ